MPHSLPPPSMAPPGSYSVQKIALFNLTAQPLPETFLRHVQQEGSRQLEVELTVEVVPASPDFTFVQMARYSKQHFMSASSPFASRGLLAVDDRSLETGSVIVVAVQIEYLESDEVEGSEEEEEKDVIEGHLRTHPKSSLLYAWCFDGGSLSVVELQELAWLSPDHIMPREESPPPGPVGRIITTTFDSLPE